MTAHGLIDTTEMYLRTIFELEEEGIVPLRARIAERLSQSGRRKSHMHSLSTLIGRSLFLSLPGLKMNSARQLRPRDSAFSGALIIVGTEPVSRRTPQETRGRS